MANNILVINSLTGGFSFLESLMAELSNRGLNIVYLMPKPIRNEANKLKYDWTIKNAYLGPSTISQSKGTSRIKNIVLFVLLLPFIKISLFIRLAYYKYFKRFHTIVCCHYNEKIIMAPLARLLGIKIIWIEYPNFNYSALSRLQLKFYFNQARHARIACFSNFSKKKLTKAGINPGNIILIYPGIKLKHFKRQGTIFETLAHKDYKKIGQKFFTVGTITSLEKEQKVETLLHAIKKCLAVIPHIQLIVVGEGKEKRQLAWLAKKLNIENLVWFVGRQKHHRKWLDSFNIFVASTQAPKFMDMQTLLKAMAAGLASIIPVGCGYDDIVNEHKTCLLFDINNSDSLAQHIITLEQNPHLQREMGKNADERVKKYFTFDKMIENFYRLLINSSKQ
jgi:glycosyltransferase involved in cell wall biosynthesis